MSQYIETETLPKPREQVLKNTIFNILAKAFYTLFLVWAMVKQTRYLGELEWGIFSYTMSSMEVFRVITNFGLDIIAIRLMAINTSSPKRILQNLIFIKASLCALGFLIIGILTAFLSKFSQYQNLFFIMAAGLLALAFTSSVTVRFQVEHRMEKTIPVQFVSGAIYLLSIYLAIHSGVRIAGFVWLYNAWLYVTLFLTAIAFYLMWKENPFRVDRSLYSKKMIRTIFLQGIPVGLLEMIVIIYCRLGIFLLEKYIGIKTVGKYFIAIKINEPLLTIATSLSTSAYPVLSRLVEQKKGKELQDRFLKYSLRSLLFSSFIAIILTFFAKPILSFIQSEYIEAQTALIILSWATVFMFQNQLSCSIINAFGKYYYETIFAVINLLNYIILSLLLIPRQGMTGAAFATMGVEGINAIMQITAALLLIRKEKY